MRPVIINNSPPPPRVLLAGNYEHQDFREAVAALRAGANLSLDDDGSQSPELVVIAQCRPGRIGGRQIEQLRRAAPLAGVVSLLGSWCEGQVRASRPVHDSLRLYWYEFAPWWRRQLALRATGRCPAWARPESLGFQSPPSNCPTSSSSGLIVLSTARWETADALSDLLRRQGYATLWQPPGRAVDKVHGAIAGVWEGGQLDDCEAEALTAFCLLLAIDAAPVVALLDFPRRDRCDVATEAGAATVLGKPCINADLLTAISNTSQTTHVCVAHFLATRKSHNSARQPPALPGV